MAIFVMTPNYYVKISLLSSRPHGRTSSSWSVREHSTRPRGTADGEAEKAGRGLFGKSSFREVDMLPFRHREPLNGLKRRDNVKMVSFRNVNPGDTEQMGYQSVCHEHPGGWRNSFQVLRWLLVWGPYSRSPRLRDKGSGGSTPEQRGSEM